MPKPKSKPPTLLQQLEEAKRRLEVERDRAEELLLDKVLNEDMIATLRADLARSHAENEWLLERQWWRRILWWRRPKS